MSYFYGPVASRRLGFSLGVDLFPKKICSFDCIYCQLGTTKRKVINRVECVDISKLKQELKNIVKKKPKINFITISGSGEPTLHKNLDKIIKAIKTVTNNKYPVCVITNSSLLYLKKVRQELKPADLIIPSLDSADQKTFAKINRPYRAITLAKILKGLESLSREFKGKIWLEIMIIAGVNDSPEQIREFEKVIKRIKPDKVQLNLPVRPASIKIKLPSKSKLEQIKQFLGSEVELISSFYDGRRQFRAVSSEQ